MDSMDVANSAALAPQEYVSIVLSVRDDIQVKGLKAKQGVALDAYETVSNQFFVDLLANLDSNQLSNKNRTLLGAKFGSHPPPHHHLCHCCTQKDPIVRGRSGLPPTSRRQFFYRIPMFCPC